MTRSDRLLITVCVTIAVIAFVVLLTSPALNWAGVPL